jgi:prephenate dehydrogenase
MTAEAHDRVMAYVSHAPQLLATTLMRVAARHVGAEGLTAAGPGLVDMTRLAASPADVWAGILGENADFAARALADLMRELPTAADLRSERWVQEAFTEANVIRRSWHPPPPAE